MIEITDGVLCSGNLTQDILTSPVDEVIFDRTQWVESIELSLGGNGANTSYALSILGVPVALIGAVGADEFGNRAVKTLEDGGVDVSRIERSTLPTPVTVVLVAPGGSRAFLHRPGASRTAFLEPIEFSAELISGRSHYHLANPFATPGMRVHAGENLRRAKAVGLTTSLDTGWDSKNEWMSVVGPCLPHLDLLFVNESEAEQLTGRRVPAEAAAALRDRGARDVVIKLGSRGCVWYGSDAVEHGSPAFEIDPVDTTGAGDAFVAGFLAALHLGQPSERALVIANAVGALVTRKLGASKGLLSFEKTIEWAVVRA